MYFNKGFDSSSTLIQFLALLPQALVEACDVHDTSYLPIQLAHQKVLAHKLK